MTTKAACVLALLALVGCSSGNNNDNNGQGAVDPTPVLDALRAIAALGTQRAEAIARFDDGSYVIVGLYSADTVFGEGEANETLLSAVGSRAGFLACFNADHTLKFAVSFGGANRTIPTTVATVGDGSCIVGGFLDGTSVFGAGEANETTLQATPNANDAFATDVFVARFNADGTLAWARTAGGENNETPAEVAAFADGSFVVGGTYLDEATFGAGDPNETTLTNPTGDLSAFVARYDGDGSLAWARTNRSVVTESFVSALTIGETGTIFVLGQMDGDTTFGEGEANETTVQATSDDVFLAGYAGNGDFVGVFVATSSGPTGPRDVRDAGNGVIVITGSYEESITFDPGGAAETTLDTSGDFDMFLAAYDFGCGLLLWARSFGGPGEDNPQALEVREDGTLLLTGTFEDDLPIDGVTVTSAGRRDVFFAHFDALGMPLGASSGGGTSSDVGVGLVELPDRSVLVVGHFIDLADFDGTPLTGVQSEDVFIAEYR